MIIYFQDIYRCSVIQMYLFKNPSETIVDNKACIKKEEANLTEKNRFEYIISQ